MGEFSKEELSKIKVKEADWKAKADAKAAIKDAALVNKVKSAMGMNQPAPAPAPVDTMGNVAGAAPAGPATGMKKGGKVAGKLATRGYGISK
jgi:hypothetical protein